jgi:hypothetical protein
MLNKDNLKNFYHLSNGKKNEDEELNLFYGKKPGLHDSLVERIPIDLFTYKTFAESVVKKWFSGAYGRKSKSKAFTSAACYIILDERTLFKSRIPTAKAILILGGNQTDLLPDESPELSEK